MFTLPLFIILTTFMIIHCYIINPGPQVKATRGAVLPKPQIQKTKLQCFDFKPSSFAFKIVGYKCKLLKTACSRYKSLIKSSFGNSYFRKDAYKNCIGDLGTVKVNLTSPCRDEDTPSFNSSEEYFLTISSKTKILKSNSVWGIMRGLETLSQLIHLAVDGVSVIVNETKIHDYPRFKFRGLLIDTSRHFLPVPLILKNLDAMAYNKLNVLHWHIVDDPSFPYQSLKFPKFSIKGAYGLNFTYSPKEVAVVIEYARERGIHVIPEFDTPGHTRSWGLAYPELLTPCFKNGKPDGRLGPINPTEPYTYKFLKDLFIEIQATFSSEYLHLGGDELGYECWRSNPDITNFMKKISISNYQDLENFYFKNFFKINKYLKVNYLVWQEVFTNNITLPKNTIVHIWKDENGIAVMRKATKAGFHVLRSNGYYLDLYVHNEWKDFYQVDPHDFSKDRRLRKLVIGGETCLWGEMVNEYNFLSTIWPRASAPAEKFWSAYNADNVKDAASRLEEHTCRMNTRGIPAGPPTGPGFCLK